MKNRKIKTDNIKVKIKDKTHKIYLLSAFTFSAFQSISGEILTHLKKNNIFLAQKLTELEHFL